MTATEAAPAAPVATATHDELTRSSTTALEGGLTTDGSVASAEEYLRPIKAAGKVPPPWLNAIARQASPLRAWWRCVATSMSSGTSDGKEARRRGLSIMLEAAVVATTAEALKVVVDSISSWAADWQDREGYLRKAMHA